MKNFILEQSLTDGIWKITFMPPTASFTVRVDPPEHHDRRGTDGGVSFNPSEEERIRFPSLKSSYNIKVSDTQELAVEEARELWQLLMEKHNWSLQKSDE